MLVMVVKSVVQTTEVRRKNRTGVDTGKATLQHPCQLNLSNGSGQSRWVCRIVTVSGRLLAFNVLSLFPNCISFVG